MDIVSLAFILLTAVGGAIAQVQLEPRNSVVLRGTDARFNCSLSQIWVVMIWSLNNGAVLTISKKDGVLHNSDRYSAVNYTTDQSYKWEFVLTNAQLDDSSQVVCDVQNIERREATLSVQERGTVAITSGNVTAVVNQPATIQCLASNWFPKPNLTWTVDGLEVDENKYNVSTEGSGTLFSSASALVIRANRSAPVECQAKVPALAVPETSTIFLTIVPGAAEQDYTVLIAVLVPILACLLLVLLIIGIIFCCRRRKAAQSSYEEEIRKSRSVNERNPPEAVQGTENAAYIPDGTKHGVGPSKFDDSGLDQTQEPDKPYNSNQTANGHDLAVYGRLENKKHRHATIV